MNTPARASASRHLGMLVLAGPPSARRTATAPPPSRALPRTDANGNPLRELRPDTSPITTKPGSALHAARSARAAKRPAVRDADTWFKQRRPELLRLYETEIYGRVPERAPQVTFAVVETDPAR